MKHLDLFSGIGGFALALDQVVDSTHVFCDNDPFCQEVLKKNYPNSKIYGDIKDITNESADIVTGGFPCQPFSQAGKRRGTEDDRYLWPEMFRVIQLAKPTWVIAENVGGLVTWNDGMVLEQVCTDLEGEGYEVQPLIIPACAVNAPHRRDRIWILGHSQHNGFNESKNTKGDYQGSNSNEEGTNELRQLEGADSLRTTVTDTFGTTQRSAYRGSIRTSKPKESSIRKRSEIRSNTPNSDLRSWDWNENWIKVATEANRMDDGLPNRVHRIKALGNSIVPQVAEEIMRGMFA